MGLPLVTAISPKYAQLMALQFGMKFVRDTNFSSISVESDSQATISGLPNEKETVYGALDKWTAWETEFPLIAAVKALRILRKRGQWVRVIQDLWGNSSYI
ncbi:hypothetical protein L3X38_001837 [Prunus dulcis]|uniref:Uncharacterized protein n=1 Tax=Prunus dulcis TaxID=3755 RepID=A0AAD4WSR8_PRUDU|nr:hypothetical protein L3X38_001837 [Prunus dulcis]